jgi:hypothetical protein
MIGVSPELIFMLGCASGAFCSAVVVYFLTSRQATSDAPGPVTRPGSNPLPNGRRPQPPEPPPVLHISESRGGVHTYLAKQQLTIHALKQRCAQHEADKEKIRDILYCIGGPLNDNILRYSREQLVPLFRIGEFAQIGFERKIEVEDA